MFICTLFPKVSLAECNFDPSPIHYYCEYFAGSLDEARNLCQEKTDELVIAGYQQLGCFGSGGTSAGWATEDQNGNRKYPFQFIHVRVNSECEGLLDQDSGECVLPPTKDEGVGCGVGNPCNPSTGNKFQSEVDFSLNEFSLIRTYNSGTLSDIGFGAGWRSNFQKSLLVLNDSLTQISESGRGEPWMKVNDIWQGDADSNILITETASGFQLTNSNGSIENYNLEGQLISSVDTNGYQINYTYNADNQLDQVNNHYGQAINFSYGINNVASVTDSLGSIYGYEYDANNNLIAIIYPDTTLNDDTDNPRKIYHYENPDYPNHLTGITDENGNRYATYAYDENGKAISTEHAQTTNVVGQERFELEYQ